MLAQPISKKPNIMCSSAVPKPHCSRFGVPVEMIWSEGAFPKTVVGQERRGRGCLEGEEFLQVGGSSVGSQSFRILCTRICRLGP